MNKPVGECVCIRIANNKRIVHHRRHIVYTYPSNETIALYANTRSHIVGFDVMYDKFFFLILDSFCGSIFLNQENGSVLLASIFK
jgi:hypothetical protein